MTDKEKNQWEQEQKLKDMENRIHDLELTLWERDVLIKDMTMDMLNGFQVALNRLIDDFGSLINLFEGRILKEKLKKG